MRTLEQIVASRKARYEPQRALIAQQQSQLPGQEQADVAGLEQAKQNSFNDITAGANAKGMLYSGAPIQEQQRYVGEKYSPALAGIKSDYAGRRTKLEASLLGLNQDEMDTAEAVQQGEAKAESEAADRAQRLALERQRMAISAAKSAQREPSATQRQQAFNQDLMSAYQQVNGGQIKYRPFIREEVANQLAAEYGIPIDQAQKQVNSVFTDSWDEGLQRRSGYRK